MRQFWSKSSMVHESCIWIQEGTRYICMTYTYYVASGQLYYAGDDKINEDIIRDVNHYKTAHERLNKNPVHVEIPKEYRWQLNNTSSHREDIVNMIVDKIFDRKKGRLQIRSYL